MILVDIAILAVIAIGGYKGIRRGVILVSLEFLSFVIATVVALALYRMAGPIIKDFAAITLPLANLSAFLIIWTVTEVLCGLIIRYGLLSRLRNKLQPSWITRTGGAVLNGLKITTLVAVGLILFAGLPLSAEIKQPVTDSYIGRAFLGLGGPLRQWLGNGLGGDLGEALNVFTVTSPPDGGKKVDLGFTTTEVKDNPAAEQTMLELANHERSSRGLPPLTVNEPARQAARAYSTRMLAEGYFSHKDPDGHSPFDRLKAGGVKFRSAGENLALAPTAQLAHQGLMNSPGHRANILSKNYHKVGIGVIDAGPHGLMVTQEFTD